VPFIAAMLSLFPALLTNCGHTRCLSHVVTEGIAKAHECSPAQVALPWILSKPVVTSVLMGAKRMDQLKDNLAAIHLKLTQDELKSLDEASQLPPEYPEWMLATQGADRLGPVDLWSKSVNQKNRHHETLAL
jgi:diketogulonate reductase-like aldo/keto reductase